MCRKTPCFRCGECQVSILNNYRKDTEWKKDIYKSAGKNTTERRKQHGNMGTNGGYLGLDI